MLLLLLMRTESSCRLISLRPHEKKQKLGHLFAPLFSHLPNLETYHKESSEVNGDRHKLSIRSSIAKLSNDCWEGERHSICAQTTSEEGEGICPGLPVSESLMKVFPLEGTLVFAHPVVFDSLG